MTAGATTRPCPAESDSFDSLGELSKQGKVAVRNVRRDGMDTLKLMERDGEISKDDQKSQADEIQKMTDEHITLIDESLATKEAEIMQV